MKLKKIAQTDKRQPGDVIKMGNNKEEHKICTSTVIKLVNIFVISLLVWFTFNSKISYFTTSMSNSNNIGNTTAKATKTHTFSTVELFQNETRVTKTSTFREKSGLKHSFQKSPEGSGNQATVGNLINSHSNRVIHESELFLRPEEIFQLKTPLHFEPAFKNPCFKVQMEYKCPNKKKIKINRNEECSKLDHHSNKTRMVCLPYFLLIGFTKCGTTAMCRLVSLHQDVRWASRKELHYWDPLRRTPLLADYVSRGFLKMTRKINGHIQAGQNGYPGNSRVRQMITGECTPRTVWGAGQRNAKEVEGGPASLNVSDYQQLTPYRIAHVLPALKIIVTMRNPIHRSMNDSMITAEHFHDVVTDGIRWMNNCTITHKLPLKVCSYGSNFHTTYGLPNLRDKWMSPYGGAYKMRIGIYHVYLEDWLKAFPKENFLFTFFEDYVKDPPKYLSDYVVPHLGLHGYKSTKFLKKIASLGTNKTKKKPSIDLMLPKTMEALKKFYKPHNEKLAKLLNDNKYLMWNE